MGAILAYLPQGAVLPLAIYYLPRTLSFETTIILVQGDMGAQLAFLPPTPSKLIQ
jgi:hypothetical protein